jgi:hypothetical protein
MGTTRNPVELVPKMRALADSEERLGHPEAARNYRAMADAMEAEVAPQPTGPSFDGCTRSQCAHARVIRAKRPPRTDPSPDFTVLHFQVYRARPGARHAYVLLGPRGGKYTLYRDWRRPELLFVIGADGHRTKASKWAWFTDAGGDLRELCTTWCPPRAGTV